MLALAGRNGGRVDRDIPNFPVSCRLLVSSSILDAQPVRTGASSILPLGLSSISCALCNARLPRTPGLRWRRTQRARSTKAWGEAASFLAPISEAPRQRSVTRRGSGDPRTGATTTIQLRSGERKSYGCIRRGGTASDHVLWPRRGKAARNRRLTSRSLPLPRPARRARRSEGHVWGAAAGLCGILSMWYSRLDRSVRREWACR